MRCSSHPSSSACPAFSPGAVAGRGRTRGPARPGSLMRPCCGWRAWGWGCEVAGRGKVPSLGLVEANTGLPAPRTPGVSSQSFCLFLFVLRQVVACALRPSGALAPGLSRLSSPRLVGQIPRRWACHADCPLAGPARHAGARRCARTQARGCAWVPCFMEEFGFHLCSLKLSTQKWPKGPQTGPGPGLLMPRTAWLQAGPSRLLAASSSLCSGLCGLHSLPCALLSLVLST